MSRPLLVLVTGAPCTGKTTLGRRIARELRLPFVSKDGIKESLFDSLGWRDREWSTRLGNASVALLYYFAGRQLEAGQSVLLECNFHRDLAPAEFQRLQQRHDFDLVEVHCQTDLDVLCRRALDRAASGERHPGHVDQTYDLEGLLRTGVEQGRWGPLGMGDHLVVVDTTDFGRVDVDSVLADIKAVSWHAT